MPCTLARGTGQWRLQGGLIFWSQAGSPCPARETEAGSPDEMAVSIARGK
jgi:hypothetical protein